MKRDDWIDPERERKAAAMAARAGFGASPREELRAQEEADIKSACMLCRLRAAIGRLSARRQVRRVA